MQARTWKVGELSKLTGLTKVNATNSSIQSLVTLVAPMLSGALLTMTTIEVIFFIDVITAAIAVSILLLFLHVPVHAKALFNTPFTVLLQQKVEPDFLGRVFGVLSMISSSLMPLAMLVYGPISDFVKIEWLLIGTGLLMVVQSLLILKSKVLIEAGKPISEN